MAIQLYLQSRMQFPRELVEKNLVKFIRVGGETCSHRSGGFNTPVLAPGKPEPDTYIQYTTYRISYTISCRVRGRAEVRA